MATTGGGGYWVGGRLAVRPAFANFVGDAPNNFLGPSPVSGARSMFAANLSVASAVLTPRWVVAKVFVSCPPSGGLPTPDLGPTANPASLSLAPKTQTHNTGWASLCDGVTVKCSVGGSVTASGSATTDAKGQARFCYTGPSKPGKGEVKAFADANGNGLKDPNEPSDTATVTWVAPGPPPCH